MLTNAVRYEFKCVQCGGCCRGTFEVDLCREDVLKWLDLGKEEYLQGVQVNPELCTPSALGGLSEPLRNERIRFLQENHQFSGPYGTEPPEHAYLPPIWGYRPILKPLGLDIILEGMNRGLTYKIITNNHGRCFFLQGNLCVIHEEKPRACRRFPFSAGGRLRTEQYIVNICKGIRPVEEDAGINDQPLIEDSNRDYESSSQGDHFVSNRFPKNSRKSPQAPPDWCDRL